jgi:hypothetical protein
MCKQESAREGELSEDIYDTPTITVTVPQSRVGSDVFVWMGELSEDIYDTPTITVTVPQSRVGSDVFVWMDDLICRRFLQWEGKGGVRQ